MAEGTTDLNRCAPGGTAGIRALALLLGVPVRALAPEVGVESPVTRALIDEAFCIGCTLCIQACPVDAILGASKHVHAVLLEPCTGCGLCLPPCPVDCIELLDAQALQARGAQVVLPLPSPVAQAPTSRRRYQARAARLVRQEEDLAARHETQARDKALELALSEPSPERERKQAVVAAALERARARRLARSPASTPREKP